MKGRNVQLPAVHVYLQCGVRGVRGAVFHDIITQCYLPPDRGNSHGFTPGILPVPCTNSFIDPGRMKG